MTQSKSSCLESGRRPYSMGARDWRKKQQNYDRLDRRGKTSSPNSLNSPEPRRCYIKWLWRVKNVIWSKFSPRTGFVDGKNVIFTLSNPFRDAQNAPKVQTVSPRGIEPRFHPPQGCALSVELWGQYCILTTSKLKTKKFFNYFDKGAEILRLRAP